MLLNRTKTKSFPSDKSSILVTKFDEFFHSKLMNIISTLCVSPVNQPDIPANRFNTFIYPSPTYILKLITSTKCASSLDPIPIQLLILLAPKLSNHITRIINESLQSGIVPDSMKIAMIRPILKKQNLDVSSLNNYRPISNLTIISKILERVVASQLTSYLSQYNILNKFQSAYTAHKSTETALTYILSDLHLSSSHKDGSIRTLLDLSSAFDTLDHKIMISRLTSIGITGTPLTWFTSYLTNRHHYIKIDNHSSTPRLLTHGVPQGYVLGPILFNIYILPLFKIFRSYPSIKFHAYADDLQIYTNISSHISNPLLLTNCINDISTWLTNNSLSLNFTKTETIKISSPNSLSLAYPTPPVIVSNHLIPFSKNIRNLGFIIDETLSPTQHIRSIARSVNYTLYTIRLIRPFINTDTAITLATALILSRFDYCNVLLNNIQQHSTNSLQVLFNNTVRVIYNIPKFSRTHISPLTASLHWLPIKSRIIYKISLIIHNAYHNNYPDYICSLITKRINKINTRKAYLDMLVVPLSLNMTTTNRRSFYISAPTIWNSLPQKIRSTTSTAVFKKLLKTYLYDIVFGNSN